MHTTGCGGHYGIVISQLQVAGWECLAGGILAIEWIERLSHWILALCLSNCLSSTIVLRWTRIGCWVVESIVSALVFDIHLTFYLVHSCPLVDSTFLVVLFRSKKLFCRCDSVFWVHILLTYYSVLRRCVKFLIFQTAFRNKMIHLWCSLRARTFENSISSGSALNRSLVTKYLKLLMGWVVQVTIARHQVITVCLPKLWPSCRYCRCQVIFSTFIGVLASRDIPLLHLVQLESSWQSGLVIDLIDKRGLVLMLHEIHSVLGSHGSLFVYSDSKVPVGMRGSFEVLLVNALVHSLELVVWFARYEISITIPSSLLVLVGAVHKTIMGLSLRGVLGKLVDALR